MLTNQEIKKQVRDHIDQISISEFVTEGGWPNLKAVDIAVYSQEKKEETYYINLDILYTTDKAGCCFIPGAEQQNRMSKKVEIHHQEIKFYNHE